MDLFPKREQSEQPNEDRFDSFMFGPRQNKKETASTAPSQTSNSQIDFVKLMEHSDTLLNSVSELSPVFRKIPSFISKLLK